MATKRYKLIRFYGQDVPNGEEWELYDLERYPREMKNEYNSPEYKAVVQTMKEKLTALIKEYKLPQ